MVVATRRLARVVEHEPADLTATVEAGLTMAPLQAALGARGQWLPLDPPEPARATLGGVLATNAAGPRRHLYGTARDLVIGVNALDYSGYPDCRPEFIAAFEQLASLATAKGVGGARFKVHTPLIALTKAQIIRRGLELGLDYGLTHSCYDPLPDGRPCGRCDSCVLRAAGFAQAGAGDPLLG